MTEHEQHKCPGCGEATLGYVGAVPLGRCRACGKSFWPRDFLPKEEPEPTLEDLLAEVESCLPPYDTFAKKGFVLLTELVQRVRKLEQENEHLRDSLRSSTRSIRALKGIPR